MKKNSFNITIIVALIPAVLVFLLIVFEPFYSLDAMFTDIVYSQMNGTGDDIKIIGINEETLNEYGSFSEWSREKSAELLDVLYADEENAPMIVGLDMIFAGETDMQTDGLLADAAKGKDIVAATNLVFRTAFGSEKSGGYRYYDDMHVDMEEQPYDLLKGEVSTGFSNAELSRDGFVRSAMLYTDVNGERKYSFAAEIYKKYMELHGNRDETVQALNGDPHVQFFYSGKPGEFTNYSLKDVIDGVVPASEFKDCIVLVGAYAPGMQDSYHSAAKRGQEMYGVEIHANIIRALMFNKTAQRVNRLYIACIAAVIFFIYMFIARKMNMYPALIIGVWIILADIIAGRLLATRGHIISLVYVLIVCVLVMAYIIIEKYVWESAKKKKVLNTFKKYMAPQVIEQMAKDDSFHIELGGVKRDVAVLFVDIRGFTALSEALNPEEIVSILNKYLSLTSECIFAHGGMLDKFIGDATMAVFNAPNDLDDYVYKAVLAGLDMQKKGAQLGDILLYEYGRTVSFGVGIHADEAVIGNIGSEMRMDYTAIGDTVNTASRIEGKSSGGEVLISEEVYRLLDGRIKTEFKEEMTLKGKANPVPVYRVLEVI